MDCLKAQTCITSYVEDELTGSDLKEFLIHIKDCPGCREELEIYYTLLVGTKQLDEGELTTSNFSLELDQKMESQLKEITYWEKMTRRIYGLTALLGILFVSWTGIKAMDLHVPVINPRPVTWEEEKDWMEAQLLPHMFRSTYLIERIPVK